MRTGNLPALQKILGHASARMTQRYAHLAQDYMMAEMVRFDRALPVGNVIEVGGTNVVPTPLLQLPLHS
jgi:hypothetical protein